MITKISKLFNIFEITSIPSLQIMKNSSLLLSLGLILNSVVLIISHFMEIPDFAKGAAMGVGIGLMILALLFRKSQPEVKI